MLRKLLPFALLLTGCSDSRRGSDAAAQADSSIQDRTRAIPAAAFRVPRGGGPLHVYELPALEATPWGAGSRLGGARSAVGMDLIGRRLLFRDSLNAVASFDLVSLRQRTVSPRHAAATIAADGALLAVDSSGSVTESQPWGTRAWPTSLGRGVRAVFAAPGPRLLAVRSTRDGDSLAMMGREGGIGEARSVPKASGMAASRDGDAVAFATDSAVVVYEGGDEPWRVRLSGRPSTLVFSPSGHRIYVALRDKSELIVVDRFSKRTRDVVDLPGPAGQLRPDPWGRVLLVRGSEEGTNDETWIVGVAKNEVMGRLKDSWASDLPAVSQSGVLLSREGNAVVARDVRTLDSLGAVPNGARDVWFAGRWVPTSGSAMARSLAAERANQPSRQSALAARTPAPAAPAAPAGREVTREPPAATRPAPATPAPASAARTPERQQPPPVATPPVTRPVAPVPAFYAQLLATRSEDAARSLAASLAPEPVKVESPRPGLGDDNWRVLAGPFASRDAADSAGRSLGRPYWVVDRSREGAARP